MAGGLGATTGSFTDYAAAIVANVASKSTQASATYTAKQTAQSTYAELAVVAVGRQHRPGNART